MDDQARIAALLETVRSLKTLDEDRFQHILEELDQQRGNLAYDGQGRLKVVFFDAKSYEIEAFDRRNEERYSLHFVEASLSLATARAAHGFQVVCIFVNDICDAPIVELLAQQGVQLIALRCAGYNNVDLAACRRHGVSVVRVPAYSPNAVADHTVALMLMLNRRLHQAYNRNRHGYFLLEGLTGFDMRGKTAGVIGTGKIGQCVSEILLGFGCRILAYDKYPHEPLAQRDGVDYVELSELLRQSDIVTLHVPLFEETYHLIDDAAIATMKDGVMLINTSRGGLVNTPALVRALKSGKIALAGLDVYEEEAGVFFHDMSDRVLTDDVLARLLTFNNVVITSHQGFLTREALDNIADATLANIRQFEQGRRGGELTNGVSVSAGQGV